MEKNDIFSLKKPKVDQKRVKIDDPREFEREKTQNMVDLANNGAEQNKVKSKIQTRKNAINEESAEDSKPRYKSKYFDDKGRLVNPIKIEEKITEPYKYHIHNNLYKSKADTFYQ